MPARRGARAVVRIVLLIIAEVDERIVEGKRVVVAGSGSAGAIR